MYVILQLCPFYVVTRYILATVNMTFTRCDHSLCVNKRSYVKGCAVEPTSDGQQFFLQLIVSARPNFVQFRPRVIIAADRTRRLIFA